MDTVLFGFVPLENHEFFLDQVGINQFKLSDRRNYHTTGAKPEYRFEAYELLSLTVQSKQYSVRAAYISNVKEPFTLFFMFRDEERDPHIADLRWQIFDTFENAKRAFFALSPSEQLKLFDF